MSDHTIVIIRVVKIFLYTSSVYSCYLFLKSSASVRSIPFCPENKTKITLISSPLHPSLLNVLKEEIQFVLLAMRLSLSQALQRAWHMMGGSWQVHGIWWLARFQLGAQSRVYRGGYFTRRSDREIITIFRTMDTHRIMFKLWISFSYMSWLKMLEDQHYLNWIILILLLYLLQV